MTLPKPTNEQLLEHIRRCLDEGYTTATAERVKSIAQRTSDPELLRGLVLALVEGFTNRKPRKPGRPRKKSPRPSNGVIDLDAMPILTAKETAQELRAYIREGAICEEIYETHKNRGTAIATLCQLHGIGTDTYYKWYPSHS